MMVEVEAPAFGVAAVDPRAPGGWACGVEYTGAAALPELSGAFGSPDKTPAGRATGPQAQSTTSRRVTRIRLGAVVDECLRGPACGSVAAWREKRARIAGAPYTRGFALPRRGARPQPSLNEGVPRGPSRRRHVGVTSASCERHTLERDPPFSRWPSRAEMSARPRATNAPTATA
jgi:predicted RNA-binding Zn-ribbon protein involved in translation (DUF1610 family)